MIAYKNISNLILVAFVLVAGCGREPDAAPTADYQSTPQVGTWIDSGAPEWVGTEDFDADIAAIQQVVEQVVGYPLPTPVVVLWSYGVLDCGGTRAYGCYHHSG